MYERLEQPNINQIKKKHVYTFIIANKVMNYKVVPPPTYEWIIIPLTMDISTINHSYGT